MRRNIFLLATITLFVLATTNYAQTPKAKPSPKETAKSTMPAWPECCWVGKTTASTNAAPEQKSESANEKNTSSESSGGVTSAGAGSGASFTSSGSEESSESSSEAQGTKENSLKQKLTDTALELLKDKLTNKQSSDTSTSSDGSSENTNSTSSAGTSSTETAPPVDSVQEVKQTDPNKRRQRMQALRERLQNSKSNPATTGADTNAPTETVQELPSGRRRAKPEQQNTDTASTVPANDTKSTPFRPQRNEQPVQTNAPERPLRNHNGGMMNGNRMERMREARQERQTAPTPRPRIMRRKP